MSGGPTVSGVADVLVRIVERREQRLQQEGFELGVAGTEERSSELAEGAPGRRFLEALSERSGNAIIAEVKMGSPKLGDLRQRVAPEHHAQIYREGGAAALSVVVEPDHFFGSYELLARCVERSGLPAIAKDFVVSEQQLLWARDAGASAVLLIAALYDAPTLRRFAAAARSLGLVPLIETHSREDAVKLETRSSTSSEYELVGVNNRDLRTFAVDLEHSMRLRPVLPPSALAVAESGIDQRGAIERLAGAGFDAFLIGESLLLAEDPQAKLAELLGRDGAS